VVSKDFLFEFMKKLCVLIAVLCGCILQSASGAVDLKQSRVTQTVNSVEIISSNTRHTAEVNDVFKMPDVMRTGAGARAEMIADDGTITRVGANTIFSFDPAERTIDLDEGSLLFHSPHGMGGGTIHTGSATASVLGTTIIVTTTPNGGFKVLCLEGEAEVRFLDGHHLNITPGQMVFVLPDGQASPIVVFRLDVETQGSLLVTGFNDPLPSMPAIDDEITRQLTLLLDGRIVDTDLTVGDNATPQQVQVVMNILAGGQKPLSNASIISSGHTVDQTLPQNYSPLDPKHTKTGPFSPPGNFTEGLNYVYGGNDSTPVHTPASGFIGLNIDLDTGDPNVENGNDKYGVPIDLSPFASDTDFDIMAQKDIRIWQSLIFTSEGETTTAIGDGLPETVALFAGDEMEIAPDSTLEADTGTFALVAGGFSSLDTSDGSMSEPGVLDGVNVLNYDGDVKVLSQTDLTWDDGGYVRAGEDIDIQSDGSLTLGIDESISRDCIDGDFEAISDYGSINANAADDVDMYDADLEAAEDVSITAGGTLDESIVYGGDINISDSDISAGRNNTPLGDDETEGGSVAIDAVNGNVMICDSDIYAYSGIGSESGNVNVYAAGTGDIESTYIYADNTVDVESSDTLTVNDDNSGESIEGYYGVTLTSDNGDVNVNGYDIQGDYGDMDVNAGNNVYITSSTLSAGYDDDASADTAEVTAEGNVNITDYSTLEASGDVSVSAYGSLSATGDSSGSGAIDIEDSYVYAGESGTSEPEGSAYLDAYNGGINLYDDEIEAYNSGSIACNGAITIAAADNIIITGYSDIEADGNVNITSGAFSEDGDSSPPEVVPTIDIENSTVYAGYTYYYSNSGGSVTIDDYNGDFYLYGDDVEAYEGDNDITGNVNIYASDGTGDIENTYIYADNSVDIESSDTLTVNSSTSQQTIEGYYGVTLQSDYGDVSVNNYNVQGDYGDVGVYAGNNVNLTSDTIDAGHYDDSTGYNTDIMAGEDVSITDGTTVGASGNVNICADDSLSATAGSSGSGAIDIENAWIFAGESGTSSAPEGSVNINAYNGGINLYEDDIYAYSGGTSASQGDININAADNVEATGSDYLAAYGNVNITSGGSVSESEISSTSTGIDIACAYIYAGDGGSENYSISGGSVNIAANNGDADLYSDDIYTFSGDDSTSGDVNVSATGDVNITGDTFIQAGANVSIAAGNTEYISALDSSPSGYGDIDIDSSTITAGNNLHYDNNNPGGSVSINAGGNVTIADESTIYAFNDIDITGGEYFNTDCDDTTTPGSVDIENSYLEAGFVDTEGYFTDYASGDVNITAYNGNLIIENSTIIANNELSYGTSGDVTINALSGTGYIFDSDIYADQTVYIETGDTLTVNEDGTQSQYSIEADEGLSLISDYGDVTSYGYEFQDNLGPVIITATEGNVYLAYGNIYAGANDTSSSDYVDITAGENVSIVSSESVEASGNVCVSADGSQSAIADTDDSSGSGAIDIEDATIEAGYNGSEYSDNGGSVYLNADNGGINLYDDDIYAYNTGTCANQGSITINANDNIAITGGAYIEADGNVNITSGQSIEGGADDTVPAGGIYIGGSSTIESGDEGSSGGNVGVTSNNGDIAIYCSDIYAYDNGIYGEGNAYINNNDGNVTISSSDIDADEDVSIMSCGTDYDTGINIQDGTTIEAGYDIGEDEISFGYGGNVVINAYNGNVTICDSDIYAYSYDSSAGNVSIYATGTGDLEDTYVDADYNVNIESVDSLTLGWDSSEEIDAGGSISLLSDTASVYVDYDLDASGDVDITSGQSIQGGAEVTGIDIEDSQIYAGDSDSISGNVNVNANNGGATISGSDIYAYSEGGTDEGDVNVNAYDGGVSICNTGIYADEDVNITSSGTDYGNGIDIDGSSTIEAGYSGSTGGNVGITSNNGDITIYCSDIYAYAEGNYGEGYVDINNNDGSVTINSSDIDADEDVSIVSCGTDYDPGINIQDGTTIEAGYDEGEDLIVSGLGGSVYIDAYNGNVNICDSDIYAYSSDNSAGNVNIYAAGTGDVEGTYVDADYNVNIESVDSLTLGWDSSEEIDAGGSISLLSDTASVYVDYDLDASGDVDITSGQSGNLSGDVTVPATGIDIEYSEIYAGDSDSVSGNVNINAYNGGVTIDSSDIYAYSEGGTDEGDVNVTAYDGGVSIWDTGIYADEDVNITSSGTDYGNGIDIEDSSEIEAGYEGSTGGNVGITSNNGDITIYCSDIFAYAEGNYGEGYVDINNNDGSVTINNSEIYAAEDVSIMSCGTDYGTGIDIEDGTTIEAGYDDSLGGNVDINAYNGSAYLSDDSVTAYSDGEDGGQISITANCNIDVLNTMLCAPNGVYLTANNGYVNVYDSYESGNVYMPDWTIWAGTEVDISADNDVTINDSTITANNGNVNINSGGEISPSFVIPSGNDIGIGEDTSIQASGSVNVTANRGDLSITGDSTTYAEGGDVILTATAGFDSGAIDIDSSTIEANGDVSMTADGDITIQDNSVITATTGNAPDEVSAPGGDEVYLSSGGEITIDGNGGDNTVNGASVDYDVGADYEIYLTASSGISLDDAVLQTLDNNYDDNIDFYANSDIDVEGGSSLYSGGTVWIESYDGDVNILSSDITANDGQVYVSSDDGTLTIDAGHTFPTPDKYFEPKADIAAFNGDAEFYGDNVAISDTVIYADDGVTVDGNAGSVTITDADIETDYGDIDMYAYNSCFDSGDGNLELTSGSSDYGVYLYASGPIDLGADNDVTIQDSQIYANTGGITISSGEDMNLEDGGLGSGVYIEAEDTTGNGFVTMTAGGNADIDDSYISADDGDVSITAQGYLSIESGNYYNTINGNNVTLTANSGGVYISGEDINANNGNLIITAGGSEGISKKHIGSAADHFTPAADTDDGDVSITANNNINVVSGIYDVQVDGPNSLITSAVSDGDLVVDDMDLETPGDLDLETDNGMVSVTGSTLISDAGNVNISASSDVTIYDTSITADSGNVNITSGGTLTIGTQDAGSDSINAGETGDVSLTSSSDMDISDTTISAGGGVSLSSGGSLTLNNSTVGYSGEPVDIEDSSIYSDDDESIESSGSLTIGVTSGDSIYANGSIDLTSDYSGVAVYGSDLESYGNGIFVSAFQGIDMENNDDIEAFNGSISLNTAGDVYLYDTPLNADNGNVCIMSGYAAENGVDIEDSEVYGSGDVGISAWYNVTLGNYESSSIYANDSISLTSEYGTGEYSGVGIFYSTVEAYNNEVSIYAPYGSVEIDSSDIEAGSGNTVDIESDSSLTATGDVSINAYGGNVNIQGTYVGVNYDEVKKLEGPSYTDIDVGGDVTIDNSDVTSGNGIDASGSIDINNNDSLTISGDYVYMVGLMASGGNVQINDSTLVANDGDVSIINSGNVNITANDEMELYEVGVFVNNICITDTGIYANDGNIYIEDTGSLSLSEPGSESSYDYLMADNINIDDSGIIANSGSVTISTPGNVNLSDSLISASSEVLDGSSSPVSGDAISISAGGSLSITGDYGDNGIYDYDIGADTSVNLQGNNSVDIENAVVETLDGNSSDLLQIGSNDGNVTINDSFLGTGGELEITSGRTISIDADNSLDGEGVYYDINVGGEITMDASQDVSIQETAIDGGSSIGLTADNGNVLLQDDVIYADGDLTVSADYGTITLDSGSVNYGVFISAQGNINLNADQGVSISDSYVAGNDVIINSESSGAEPVEDAVLGRNVAGDKVTSFDPIKSPFAFIHTDSSVISPADYSMQAAGDFDLTASDVENPGYITVNADGAVNVESSSTLAADGGSISITAGTTAYVDDSDVYAYGGDVNVSSTGATDVEDSELGANGNITIESGDTLTVEDSSYLYAVDGVSLTSDNGDVDIYDSGIYAYQGGVSVTATQGALDIEDNGIYAFGGDVDLSGAGDVYLYDNGIFAYDGNINITSSGSTVEIEDGPLDASGNITATSAEMLSVDTDHDFSDYDYNYSGPLYFDIYSGGSITLTGGSCASVQDTTMFAQDSLMISGSGGNVLVEDSDIETGSGDLNITAPSGDLTLDMGDAGLGIYLQAGGSVNLSSGGDVEIDPADSAQYGDIYADDGDVTINSTGGYVDVENMYISATGNVNITTTGTISGSPETPDFDLYYSTVNAEDGSANLYADYGSANVLYSTINAGSDIDIQAGVSDNGSESVTLFDDSVNAGDSVTVSAPGEVSITSDSSAYGITAKDGGVTVQSTYGPVDIEDVNIDSRELSNISISGSSEIDGNGNVEITAEGGSVDISSADSLTLDNVGINIGGNITVSGSTITADGGEVDLTSTGLISITGGNSTEISGTSISGGEIDVTGSSITAATDVNIDNENSLSLVDAADFDVSELDNVEITSDSTITANDGWVNINAPGSVEVNSSVINATGVGPDALAGLVAGEIDITAGGDIDVEYSSLNGSDEVLLTADAGHVYVVDSFLSDDLTMDDWSISAGTYVQLKAGDNLTISDNTIMADGGNVTITSGSPVITGSSSPVYDTLIQNSTIEAYDSVLVGANQGDADISSSTLTADNGNIDVHGTGNVDIENSTLSAEYPSEIDYGPGTTLGSTVDSATTLTVQSSTGGNITISGDNNVTLVDDTIYLGPDINVNAASLTADTGDVDFNAGQFTVDAGGTESLTGCTFNNGSILIGNNSTIQATTGNVNLFAGYNITIGSSTISATPGGTDSDFSSGLDPSASTIGITSEYGDIDISATEGNVVLTGSTFNLGGNVNITSDETIASSGGDVDITAGQLVIYAGGTEEISGCTINGGQINISGGSTVSANNNVNLTAQDVNVGDSIISGGNSVDINATGSVTLSSTTTPDTSVTSAGTGSGAGISVTAADGITVSGTSLSANTTSGTVALNNASGEVVVNNGSTIQTAYLTVDSGDGILLDGSSGHYSGNTMNLSTSLGTAADDTSGDHTVTVQYTDLSGFASMNVQGHTVNLNNDNFSSTSSYNFTSFYHGYYINNGDTAGYVNFNNDKLNNTAITVTGGATDSTLNPANNGNIINGGTGAGIHIN